MFYLVLFIAKEASSVIIEQKEEKPIKNGEINILLFYLAYLQGMVASWNHLMV